MSNPISPLGLQNVNNELKAGLIECVGAPSQLLQLLIDQSGGKQAAALNNAKYITDESINVGRGDSPCSKPGDEVFRWRCHGYYPSHYNGISYYYNRD
jgi:hypothetical protein